MVKVPSRSEGLLAEDVQHDSNSETAEKILEEMPGAGRLAQL